MRSKGQQMRCWHGRNRRGFFPSCLPRFGPLGWRGSYGRGVVTQTGWYTPQVSTFMVLLLTVGALLGVIIVLGEQLNVAYTKYGRLGLLSKDIRVRMKAVSSLLTSSPASSMVPRYLPIVRSDDAPMTWFRIHGRLQ
jgi:hypothetical protein